MTELFLSALFAGIGVAIVAGPLGCFVVWRRLAYFGAAVSHSALFGVVLGYLMQINMTVAVILFCVLFSWALVALERTSRVPSDSLLGILAHGALALGLLIVAKIEGLQIDLMSFLFGDVLAVSNTDLIVVGILVIVVFGGLYSIWQTLLIATVSEDLAQVEGYPVRRAHMLFVFLLAIVIAVGMKIVGVLLVVSLLIIPAAAARAFVTTPEQMAAVAAGLGCLSVALGLGMSFYADLPSGPAIAVVASAIFLISLAVPAVGAGRIR